MSKITRVTDAGFHPRTEEDGKIYFHVYLNAKDGRPCAYSKGFRVTADDRVMFVDTYFGIPLEKAWKNAKEIAGRYEAEEIIIYDPDDLFPFAV